MRRLPLLTFLALFLSSLAASAGPSDPFRAERLTKADARILQAALALSGHYSGLLDGDWGRGSAAALVSATGARPTEADALAVLAPLLDEAHNGWGPLNSDSVSMLLPGALVRMESGDADPYLSIATPSRDLIVRVFFDSPHETGDRHRWLKANRIGAPYDADTPAAYVTSGRIPNGDTVYLWTPESPTYIYTTVLVQWAPRQAHRARLVTASLSTRHVPDLIFERRGYLQRITDAAGAPPAPPRQDPPPATGASGTATGFHVSATAIVTAEHVVDGCRELRLEDGTRVTLHAKDPGLDLAVLLRPSAAGDWLALADAPPRLGAAATAIGYPFSGIYAQGVTATGGNVSALRGLGGSPDRMLLSAPVQPGNSGGPLLDRFGAVVGVVIARADEDYARKRAGSTPENMNVAVQVAVLRDFLAGHDVIPAASAPLGPDAFADGLPDEVVRAVVQIRCLG